MLAKAKLNSMEILISKALIDLYISFDDFLVNNVLKEYDEMKEEIKNVKSSTFHERMLSYCLKQIVKT